MKYAPLQAETVLILEENKGQIIMDHGLYSIQKRIFSLHKMLIDALEWCGLLVDYCDVFLSAVWTLILTAPIHCRGSIGEQVL